MMIRIAAQAEAEIEEARQVLTDRSLELADRMLDELTTAFSEIAGNPQAFPSIEPPLHRAALKTFPYFVVYDASSEDVVIVAFVSARRAPQEWREPSK